MNKILSYYLPEFLSDLQIQIEKDQIRWGDTWKKRPRKGQVDRVMARFADYQDQFNNGDKPFPWLKVAGEALIGYVRDKYPDTYHEQQGR